MNVSPVHIFPWQRPFLPDLKNFLERVSNGRPGSVLLIAPHNRPWRYLTRLYADAGHAGLLPRFMPLADVITAWRARISSAPLHMAAELDRVALLHECVTRLARDDQRLAARFAHMDMARFLPWGLRLGNVFEEMLAQRLTAVDLAHVEEEAAQPAAALLGALGRISKAYLDALAQCGWTTPGLDAFAVAEDDGPIPPFFRPAPERPVVMAGFALLSGSEDALLRRLRLAGGHVCLHADPALATGAGQHWSCDIFADLLRRWKAPAELAVTPDAQEAGRRPRISFFAGYDGHSQLQALRDDLAATPSSEAASTAVVLTDNALLMPVLHHLPDKNVNISMGYPLDRSPLNRLLEAVLQLRETRAEDGRFYWRNLLQCLRHPYLNMLCAPDGQGGALRLRDALRRLEHAVRRGPRFVDWDVLAADCAAELPVPLRALLDGLCEHVLRRSCAARTTDDMAAWLLDLCDFLLRNGGDMWRHFPLDAEAMYRLARHAVPALRRNCLAHTPFPVAALHSIARQVLRQERVPFEAEPLTGLQVLGMLETRLLHFDRVLVLDATDDKLPGNPAQDPLLPDSLRRALGLPDAHRRERAAAYTLYRLCAGARDVRFFWQEGITRSTLFDGKKSRSRFVEQFIWQEEQRRGRLLAPGRAPLLTARCTVRPAPVAVPRLERAPALAEAMNSLLNSPLSATRLDVYQQCPLRFARQHLCGLEPPREVNEGDDPAAVGFCIHETLRALFEPYLNREVRRGDISRETLRARFLEALERADLRRLLPPDSCLMLEESAPVRLWSFLENQPQTTFIAALEKKLEVTLPLADREYAFTGVMDRLDRRDGLLHILDYKTGTLKKHEGGLWTDTAFFHRVQELCGRFADGAAPDAAALETLDALFEELRLRLPSMQLPCYIVMAQAGKLGPLGDAALVELRAAGREYPLFGGLVDEDLDNAVRYCGLALSVTVLHMRHAPFFAAKPDKHCDWCPYAALCAV